MNHETTLAQGPVDVNVRPCTCHPDDNPPTTCARKYALGECLDEMLHTAWRGKLLDLAREYRIADDGNEVRDAWRELREHIGVLPASIELTVPELRAGIERLRCAIEAMRVAGGMQEFQSAFDAAKALVPNEKLTGAAHNEKEPKI